MLDLSFLSAVHVQPGCGGGVVDGCNGGVIQPGCNGGVVDSAMHTASLAAGHASCGGGVVDPGCNGGVVEPGCNGGVVDGGAHTTSLGAGPEVYNNMEASHNCVGGSEQGCIPDHPPVGDASKTGMSHTLPPPAHWYANGSDVAMKPSQALAVTAASAEVPKDGKSVSAATPGHLAVASHAFALAAIQGALKGDFQNFKQDAARNAESMTPVGGFVVRQMTA